MAARHSTNLLLFGDAGELLKRCYRCRKVFPIDEFGMVWRQKGRSPHRQSYCRPCQLDVKKELAKKKPEKYRRANHRRNILKKHGLSSERYYAMLDAQGGLCAICGRPETAGLDTYGHVQSLTIDHCHSTGKIRGLLCGRCNCMIGKAGDDPVLLRKGIAYLERFA